MIRIGKEADGQTIIEFALVAVLFFLLLLGIVEFAIMMFNQQVITNAGREGARFGVVARPVGGKITSSQVTDEARSFAETNVVAFGNPNFTVGAQFSSGLQSCEKTQDLLTVTVRYDYSFLFLPFAKKTMESQSSMFCE